MGSHPEKDQFSEGKPAGYNLEKANLAGAILMEANLERANLVEANLKGAIMWGVILEGANLERANLEGADITPEQLAKAKSLEGATMPDGTKYKAEDLEENQEE